MKHIITTLILLCALSASGAPLTLETLAVDKAKRSICGVTLGMTAEQVRTALGKLELNHRIGQKFDFDTKSMIPDQNLIEVCSAKDTVIYSIVLRDGKVWLQEILFAGYDEAKARSFAAQLWKPEDGTAIDISGRTIQVYQTK